MYYGKTYLHISVKFRVLSNIERANEQTMFRIYRRNRTNTFEYIILIVLEMLTVFVYYNPYWISLWFLVVQSRCALPLCTRHCDVVFHLLVGFIGHICRIVPFLLVVWRLPFTLDICSYCCCLL